MGQPWLKYQQQGDQPGNAPWLKYQGQKSADGKGDMESPPEKSLAGFASNIWPDTKEQALGIWNMVRHPIDTGMGIADVATGGVTNGLNVVLPDSMQIKPQNPREQEMLDKANAVGKSLKENYGGLDAIGNTLYKHPVGAAVDAVSLASGGEGLLRKAGMETAADSVRAVSKFANPAVVPEKIASTAGGLIAAPFRGRFAPSSVAEEQIQRIIDKSGQSPDAIKSSLDQAAQEGQPQFMMTDALGDAGRQALSTVARSPNAMRQTIVDTLINRQAGQGDRLGSFVADASGTDKTAQQTVDALTKARGKTADRNYSAARKDASAVDVSRTLDQIDSVIGDTKKFDVGIAPDSTEAALLNAKKRLGVGTAQEGQTGRTDFNSLLLTKRDLADARDAAFKAGRGNLGNALKGVVKSIDADLEAASPAYRQANDIFSQMSRPIEAVDMGKAAAGAGRRAEDNIAEFNGPASVQTKHAFQQAYRTGYADTLQKKFEGAPEGVNKARTLSSDKVQQEIAAILQDPDLLKRRIGRENTMFDTRQRALGGSLTADNLANEVSMFEPAGLIDAYARDGVKGVAGKLLKGGKDIATGQSPVVREKIAEALLSTDPTELFSQLRDKGQSAARRSQARQQAILRALVGGQISGEAARN